MADSDLPLAEHAYATLIEAKPMSRDKAADLVRKLKTTTQNKGNRAHEVEITQADAWLAICDLSRSLDAELETDEELWTRAIRRTEDWRNLIS